ncbi:MAG: hypothetical protein ACI9GZ_001010 [Bacteroidia bacterium]|jgi:hypothetical protein
MKFNRVLRKNYRFCIILLIPIIIQLSSCIAKKELAIYNNGTYWTNKNYLVSPSKQYRFSPEEHLFQLSDSLIVHQSFANNELTTNQFEISYVSHKGPYESIFHAKKYSLLFHLDKKNNFLKVFSRSLDSSKKGKRLIMTHTQIREVEEIKDEYALNSIKLAKNK